MKKILYINCCMRQNSRTQRLCQSYLDEINKNVNYEIQEVKITDLDIKPFDEVMLNCRNLDIASESPDADTYRLAYDFADADVIIIAAPYWDASFPSKLKVYIEHICVNGITFAYTHDGSLVKKCRADRLVYITTTGGYINPHPSVQFYMEELCTLFGIENFHFYCAQGIDVFPDKAEQILSDTLKEMLEHNIIC